MSLIMNSYGSASHDDPTCVRPGRLAWASVLAVLAAAMVVDRAVSGAHVAVGLGLVVLARAAGLTAVDLGLARSTWPAGLRWGVAAAALVGAAYTLSYLIMPVRQAIPDPGGGLGRVALTAVLVVIPLGTVLPEELAFRGLLLPLLGRRHGVRRDHVLLGPVRPVACAAVAGRRAGQRHDRR
jgi:membrane protease YdiL (CAAX protease family)